MIIKCRKSLVNIYGKHKIHKSVKIGAFCEIQNDVDIGENSVIQSHSFLCSGVSIGMNCFIGHGVMTINDLNPIPNNPNFDLKKTIIGDNVSIGTGAIIFPVTIGHDVVIGAGTVVLSDVPPFAVVVGNPGRIIKYKDEAWK